MSTIDQRFPRAHQPVVADALLNLGIINRIEVQGGTEVLALICGCRMICTPLSASDEQPVLWELETVILGGCGYGHPWDWNGIHGQRRIDAQASRSSAP